VVTNGGAVAVNSNSSTAVQWTGRPRISASELDIVGNDTDVSGVFPSGTLNLKTPTMADPLISMRAPARPAKAKPKKNGSLPPGYYPNGLPAGVLTGGIYYVDNGISLSGDQSIDGTAGAMIYLHSGGISLRDSSTLNVNAMTGGAYAGISFFQARANDSSIDLRASSGQYNTGAMYFPAAQVTVHGAPDSFANQLIADTLVIQQNAQLTIDYDGRNPILRHSAFIVK